MKKGSKHTPEARAKMSARLKGLPSPLKGRSISPEHRAKIIASKKGQKHTPETRAKISERSKALHKDLDYRAKMTVPYSNRGKANRKKEIAKVFDEIENDSFLV